MKRWVWMNGWDVEGREPVDVIGFLQDKGLNGCSMGLSYHGGRMLLASHPNRVVFEHPSSALYFRADRARFPNRLVPAVDDSAATVERFLVECARRGFDAQAWTVLCHNDASARPAPACCMVNAFGEHYAYALCPANELVQDYCTELCRQAARVEGVSTLDIEALGFLGLEHQGLHDKRGIPVPPEVAYWLSICCCPECRRRLGNIDVLIRARVRQWLEDPWQPVAPGFEEALAWRRDVQLALLRRIRESTKGVRLNLRVALDPRFSGGKSTLPLGDLNGLVDEATLTFLGSPLAAMRSALAALPGSPVPLNTGCVFHAPDCVSEDDVRNRAEAMRAARPAGQGFYSFGMASRPHWEWLKRALQGDSNEVDQT